MPPLSTPRPSRARSLGALVALGMLMLPLVGFTAKVTLAVDGELVTARVASGTVGDVLTELAIPVGPADRVVPPLDTPVVEGLAIRIERAIRVVVRTNTGPDVEVVAPVQTVGGAVAAAGHPTARADGAVVEPTWRTPVRDGDVVDLRFPVLVGITVDGERREVRTVLPDVAAVLEAEGVVVGPADRMTPDPSTAIVGTPVEVVIERVTEVEEVVEVSLGWQVVNRRSADLDLGVSRVEQEGRSGRRLDTYRVVYVDGAVESRDLVGQVVVEAAQDRIVVYGTKVTSGSTIWDQLAWCEARGNWALDGPLYDGGLQFHPDTWNRYKLAGYPEYAWMASREAQIEVGIRVQAAQGWRAWPTCASKLGLL